MRRSYLVITNKKAVTRVELSEIMYVLRDGRRLIVATENKEYVYYDKMRTVASLVGDNFYRLLGRFIVNLEYIKSVDVENRRIVFRNDEELFFGRDACAKLKVVFLDYLIRNNEEDSSVAAEDDEGAADGYIEKTLATSESKL